MITFSESEHVQLKTLTSSYLSYFNLDRDLANISDWTKEDGEAVLAALLFLVQRLPNRSYALLALKVWQLLLDTFGSVSVSQFVIVDMQVFNASSTVYPSLLASARSSKWNNRSNWKILQMLTQFEAGNLRYFLTTHEALQEFRQAFARHYVSVNLTIKCLCCGIMYRKDAECCPMCGSHTAAIAAKEEDERLPAGTDIRRIAHSNTVMSHVQEFRQFPERSSLWAGIYEQEVRDERA